MPDKLPKRKRTRLKYDYAKEGYYFITICTKNRIQSLGKIKNEISIELTQLGLIVQDFLKEIEATYNNVIVDDYVIMPNHVHIILIIDKKAKTSIPKIIQQYKGMVSKKIGKSIWQKSFYEHIIRNEIEYIQIKEYVQNNIINWNKDKYY